MTIDPTGHPRPSLRRDFTLLDGSWEFALGSFGDDDHPSEVTFDRRIKVPFAPETPASGIGESRVERCWYRRELDVGVPDDGSRAIVHFGAVDRRAVVWANGRRVGDHLGGYTPFEVDVTDAARRGDGRVALELRADDDPTDLDAPRGKQDWRDDPHAIWYPRTTGIWRSCFVETRGDTHVASIEAVGDPDEMTLTVSFDVGGPLPDGLVAYVRVTHESSGVRLVDDRCVVSRPRTTRTVALGDGGIDDRWALPWFPRRPSLLTVEVSLETGAGRPLDQAESTTALRTVSVDDGHFCINGRPYPLRLVLDQGYWPRSGATPPDPQALETDLNMARALGFNGVRKHQKTEDPRFLALADRLGMLVWVEMPSAYRAGPRSAAALVHEWAEVIEAHRSHPSVVAWVPVNESWGVDAIGRDHRQRAVVGTLASMAGALDGTRPVSANDGWETRGGDIVGMHDYTQDPALIEGRYGTIAAIEAMLASGRADGRAADVDYAPLGHRAPMLTEFGGVAMAADVDGGAPLGTDGTAWGYDQVRSTEEFVARYRELWASVHRSDVLSGACWTQLTDTYQEVNGLLTAERKPKAPIEELAAATRGHNSPM